MGSSSWERENDRKPKVENQDAAETKEGKGGTATRFSIWEMEEERAGSQLMGSQVGIISEHLGFKQGSGKLQVHSPWQYEKGNKDQKNGKKKTIRSSEGIF